ncbi:MAG: hypothetical protein ACHP9Y_06470, partial [Gammaproteobacteria bacterium]
MADDIRRFLDQLQQVRSNSDGGVKSPHKYLFLLALARLYELHSMRANEFTVDGELESAFSDMCNEFFPNRTTIGNLLIELPFIHLVTDGIWLLTVKKEKDLLFNEYREKINGKRLTRNRIIETVQFGSLVDEWHQCYRDQKCRDYVVAELRKILSEIASQSEKLVHPLKTLSRVAVNDHIHGNINPFVGYLNSLQRLNASNDGALAEYQARNPNFVHIHVSHPVTKAILAELKTPAGRHVILTGHAGDGKSTVALELYKQLSGIPMEKHLAVPLETREDIQGTNVSILKD